MRETRKYLAPVIVATAALLLAGCAPSSASGGGAGGGGGDADASAVDVSIIYSETGPLAAYGAAYKAGLEAGLDYATDGTNKAGGHPINITYSDDAGDADKAVSLAKDAIGKGSTIIAGTVVSGIALALAEQAEQNKILYISGPAAVDQITGINDYTFRSGRQTYQDIATAGTFIGDPSGKKVVVFAQDTAFGQGNLAGVQAVLGEKGADVSDVLVPEDATEFTPFAQKVLAAKPDLVFVAWAGATSGAMWESLQQQGVFDKTTVVTGLGDVATYEAFGAASDKINFLNHYFPGATDNKASKAMDAYLDEHGASADLFSPDGFNAGIMIAHAVEEGAGDVDAMVKSLEGFSFEGPKGTMTVRAEDHALLQPMFQAKLVQKDGKWVPELVKVVDAETVAPPVAG
ncbi:amino acid/amide ABC transporter substrate-binding protein, HAAT family [Paramicrobacterium humi]|uniref:Amino acid/amide ABC transporter substrate-binding protein, HAAT family n=1 Tax=Paramicrobacterium humi TaxID=640635 RepID=A0A1H4PHD3_9MICO|nr:substrate-binding domain-containing protein [Microbacterium humi]SEC06482.1 amino acid/amide ABC transporter substrate-binding protein, HAAT family [Microbacterium humi]